MEINLLANGRMTKYLEKEFLHLKTGLSMKDSGWITREMGLVVWNWRMGISIRGSLQMIKKMEKEFTSIKMEESWKDIGKMTNSLDKLKKKLILK
jgi:hypothetical protein